MKKSKGIQLILITAALASCNREWVPRKSVNADPADSTLTATPAGGVDPNFDPYGDPLDPCDCPDPSTQLWNYSFNPFGFFYIRPVGSVHYSPSGIGSSGSRFGKGLFRRSSPFVVRGGIGKSAFSGGGA